MKREPVLSTNTITAVVAAVIALAAAFGMGLTKEQTAAIMGLVTLLAPVVSGLIARQFVTPVAARDPKTGRFTKHGPETTPFTGSH